MLIFVLIIFPPLIHTHPEGRSRLGGRVMSVAIGTSMDDSPPAPCPHLPPYQGCGCVSVELGAQWIHSLTADNPIYNLSKQANRKLTETSCDDEPGDDVALFDATRHRWLTIAERDAAFHAWEKLKDAVASEEESVAKALPQASERDSLGAAFRRSALALRLRDTAASVASWCLERVGIAYGLDVDNISYSYWKGSTADGEEGEGVIDAPLHTTVVEPLATPLVNAGIVNFNTKVTGVAFDPTGGATDDCCMRVSTADGRVFRARHVLVTVPLGVLQTGTPSFDPPLPAEKMKSIGHFQPGMLNIVVLRFPHVFWPNQGQHFFGLLSDVHTHHSLVPTVSGAQAAAAADASMPSMFHVSHHVLFVGW
jgi:polyamine oxidase